MTINSALYHSSLLKGKVALITGGRSGIGYEVAQLFVSLGAKVIIASRNQELLAQAQKTLTPKQEPVSAIPCDIRNLDQIKNLTTQINKQFGRLDILINNAGGQFPSLAENLKEKGWDAVINNNLNGTFYITKAMANTFFIPQNSGVIVNVIANIIRGFPGMAHTGAARAGVENLTKTLAQEWATHQIRINCVAPGIIASSGLSTYPKEIQAVFEHAKEVIPFKRFGDSKEVANAICFLASDLSSYISGTTLYVDGAQHLNYDNLALVEALKKFLK